MTGVIRWNESVTDRFLRLAAGGKGPFDAAARTVGDQYRVYARYVGEVAP